MKLLIEFQSLRFQSSRVSAPHHESPVYSHARHEENRLRVWIERRF